MDSFPDMEPSNRPLYEQIGEAVRQRVASSVYRPGTALPAESRLAIELKVSQGTIRKALDALVAENVLVRRQGLGTFVAEHTRERMLCLYFNIAPDDGARVLPESRQLSLRRVAADRTEQDKLGLQRGARVLRIKRLRQIGSTPIIIERLTLPCALFPGLGEDGDVPEFLYPHFQSSYGVMISRVREELRAIGAPQGDAALLGVAAGTPLLAIDRVALTISRQPVEWRRISCRTEGYHYACERS